MSLSLPVMTYRPALGTFKKGADGSVQLSFSLSGGANCDSRCSWHPDRTDAHPDTPLCYAATKERRMYDGKLLFAKLARHEKTDPSIICDMANRELRFKLKSGAVIPWFRISAFGSVPMPSHVTKRFRNALRRLLNLCVVNNIPIHFPVETAEKRNYYQKVVGKRCLVRLSSQNLDTWLTDHGASSFVVGDWSQDFQSRVRDSKVAAKVRTECTGRKTIVCPAVVAKAPKDGTEKKAKCGRCTACANKNVDVVYPAHG